MAKRPELIKPYVAKYPLTRLYRTLRDLDIRLRPPVATPIGTAATTALVARTSIAATTAPRAESPLRPPPPSFPPAPPPPLMTLPGGGATRAQRTRARAILDQMATEDQSPFIDFVNALRGPDDSAADTLRLMRQLEVVGVEDRAVFRAAVPNSAAIRNLTADAIELGLEEVYAPLQGWMQHSAWTPAQQEWVATALGDLPWAKRVLTTPGFLTATNTRGGISLTPYRYQPNWTQADRMQKAFSIIPPNQWEQVAAHLNALHHPDLSMADMSELAGWITRLTPEARATLPVAYLASARLEHDADVSAIDVASMRAAMGLSTPRGSIAHWHAFIAQVTGAAAMSPLSDTLPLKFLMPYRGHVRECLAAAHPDAVAACRAGDFDATSAEHRLVDYYRLLDSAHLYKYVTSVDPSFNYQSVRDVRAEGDASRQRYMDAAGQMNAEQSIYLGYEEYVYCTEVIEPIQAQLDALAVRRKKIEVANVTLAGIQLSPGDHHKSGMVFTKQSSADVKINPDTMNPDLWSREFWTEFFAQDHIPLLVIADGTPSLQRSDAAYNPCFPASFDGYRNVAIQVNEALGVSPYAAWREKGLNDRPFRPHPGHAQFIEMLGELGGARSNKSELFDIHYLSVSDEKMVIREFRPFHVDGNLDRPAPELSIGDIKGGGMVFVQLNLTHADIERRAAGMDPAAIYTLDCARAAFANRIPLSPSVGAGEDADQASEFPVAARQVPATFDNGRKDPMALLGERPMLFVSRNRRVMIKHPAHKQPSDFGKRLRDHLGALVSH